MWTAGNRDYLTLGREATQFRQSANTVKVWTDDIHHDHIRLQKAHQGREKVGFALP